MAVVFFQAILLVCTLLAGFGHIIHGLAFSLNDRNRHVKGYHRLKIKHLKLLQQAQGFAPISMLCNKLTMKSFTSIK